MSPSEYIALVPTFLQKLEERLTQEGYKIKPIVVQQLPNIWIILVLNEVYQLYNDGNRCNWEFLGFANDVRTT